MEPITNNILVDKLKRDINRMLEYSADEKVEGRVALAVLLEKELMETGNYAGFKFLDPEGDESRRHYF